MDGWKSPGGVKYRAAYVADKVNTNPGQNTNANTNTYILIQNRIFKSKSKQAKKNENNSL